MNLLAVSRIINFSRVPCLLSDIQSTKPQNALIHLFISHKKVKIIEEKVSRWYFILCFWDENFVCAISVNGLVPIWHQAYIWNFGDLISDYRMLKKKKKKPSKCYVMFTDSFCLISIWYNQGMILSFTLVKVFHHMLSIHHKHEPSLSPAQTL